jgi:Rrf2 family cysteine metabolism transcriptional repressor
MTLSTRVRYAVRLMIDIAQHGHEGEAVPLRAVAARQGLSRVYLSQLTVPLRNAALLRSVWGNRGGFLLGRPAGDIRVLDVVEAVDGPICTIDCAVDPNYCPRSSRCEAIGMWRALNEGIVTFLANQTLEGLIAGSSGSAHPEQPFQGCGYNTFGPGRPLSK